LSYSETPATVQVQVHREYGQLVLWSSTVCALIAVAVLSTIVVKRNRGIRRLNVELEQRVKERTAKLEREMAENRELHEQLLQTQKLDALGTLASGVAHDFNNSLAAVMGFAELAKMNWPDSPERIEHILSATRQAAGMTKSLLAFSQRSPGEKTPRDLIELVQETSSFLRQTLPNSIKLSCTLPESATIWCSIDEVHIQQVLVNVTVNARDALPDGGEISILVREHPTRSGFAQLVIADNGTGMPQTVRERIFDPFFTTKSRGQGTGLGMAVAHGIIENHEGQIEIESPEGQGTTVSIALPRCPPAESTSQPPDPVLDGRGETILVAEDNSEVQMMLESHLRSAGFRVLTAEDGLQALRVLRQEEVHVRLAIDLPKKDGLACLGEISSQFPNLPTIMMSGLPSVDPTQLASPFLRKPFTRGELLSTISAALQRSTTS
jgi:two-component system, cell cycle sensor histidine kinase and response regulator CckA